MNIKTTSYIKLGRVMFALRSLQCSLPEDDLPLDPVQLAGYAGLEALAMVEGLSVSSTGIMLGNITVIEFDTPLDQLGCADLVAWGLTKSTDYEDEATAELVLQASRYADALDSMFHVTRVKQALNLIETVSEYDILNVPPRDPELDILVARQLKVELSSAMFAGRMFGPYEDGAVYARVCRHAVKCSTEWTVLAKGEETPLYYYSKDGIVTQFTGAEFEAVSIF